VLFIFRIYPYFLFRIARIGAVEISWRVFVVHHIFVLRLFQLSIKDVVIIFQG